jgi:sRNA-binding regulator protein Hfq
MKRARTAVLVVVGCLLCAVVVAAQSPLNAQASMHDNLNALMAAKKPVVVILKNGTNYHAAIGSVGDHFVVLTQPAQKEFFDVLVAIDEIAAVEVRAREQ